MAKRAKLQIVLTPKPEPQAQPEPVLRPKEDLWIRSQAVYTDSTMQLKWIAAINYLREQSKKGWCADQFAPLKKEELVLK